MNEQAFSELVRKVDEALRGMPQESAQKQARLI